MWAVGTAGVKQKEPSSTNTRFSLTWLETGKQSKQEKEGLGSGEKERGENFLLSDKTVFTPSFQREVFCHMEFQMFVCFAYLVIYCSESLCCLCWHAQSFRQYDGVQGCLPISTRTLAVKLVTDAGFVRNYYA